VNGLDFLWVALLGGLVGTGEPITRYRDAPTAVLRSAAALHSIKVLNLGLVLMNAVGPGVLRTAVESLADKIKDVPAQRAEVSP
jgi:hypothetical protein